MDAIAPPIRTALELFETTLADVRFADLDAKTLARAAADVHAVAAVVASAQAALDSARSALQERQDILLERVQQAIAYARVYAENDEALTHRLQAIALPRSPRAARAKDDALVLPSAPHSPTRPRTGKRKVVTAGPMLAADLATGETNQMDDVDGSLAIGSG